MNGKRSALILSICFAIAAAFLCPPVKGLFGYNMAHVTDAIRSYYWIGTCLFALLALVEFPSVPIAVKNLGKYGILAVLILASVELASALAYRLMTGNWAHSIVSNQNQYLFEEHPQLVGSLIKNANHKRGNLTYSHNSSGYRSEEFARDKPLDKIRIVALGGSTTYGVGVNNNETWPNHLAEELGAKYEVINMGVPGYSSAENIIQTELYLSELQPDVAIYLIGLNDLRNINIEGLKPDYSDFHRPSLYGAFGLCENENLPSLASLKLLVLIGQKLSLVDVCPNQAIDVKTRAHNGVDEHAFSIYVYNLNRIVEACRTRGIEVMFVPQILLEEVLKTGDYSWWVPYVPTEKVDDMMRAYNIALKAVANNNGVPFVSDVLEHSWQKEDFVDLSHFNNEANMELAQLIATKLRSSFKADSTGELN